MGSNVNGFQNEISLIDYLNNKKINDLNSNMREFICFLFPNITCEDVIKASSGKGGQKPDLEIEINNIKKFVSIKIGSGNSVHQENINLFINFLKELNVSDDIIEKLLFFHWGDGTIDGTGTTRISSSEYKKNHENEILLINNELNSQNILPLIINRILFQGKSKLNDFADCIYYGDVMEGHWALREEIIEYIMNNTFDSNSVHFGPLNYQIWNRNLKFNPQTENRRSVMQVKWPGILIDIINIESERL